MPILKATLSCQPELIENESKDKKPPLIYLLIAVEEAFFLTHYLKASSAGCSSKYIDHISIIIINDEVYVCLAGIAKESSIRFVIHVLAIIGHIYPMHYITGKERGDSTI